MDTNITHQPLIEINHVHFNRGERVIFNDISLSIPRYKITAILGPSGTGKTTLLRMMTGIITPDRGDVIVNGHVLKEMTRSALNVMRRDMGMLFQSGALFTGLSVFDNIAFPLREHTDLPESMIRDLVLMKLQAVGLRGARDFDIRELSGGMARRVALARAIALDPKIILYDEPFTGQDPIAMGVLVQLIRLLNDSLGMTSVLVSHDVKEAFSIADYVYIIANGQVISQGMPEELEQNPSAHVQQFLQGLPDGPVPFHYPVQDYTDDLMMEQ